MHGAKSKGCCNSLKITRFDSDWCGAKQMGYDMDVALGFDPGRGEFDSHYPYQLPPK